MDRETIIKLADEANIWIASGWEKHGTTIDELIRFAKIVTSAEREACAKLAETPIGTYDVVVACGSAPVPQTLPRYMDYYDIAQAIRLRGNT